MQGSSHRSTVSENQEPSTPDNELEPPIDNKGARWRLRITVKLTNLRLNDYEKYHQEQRGKYLFYLW